jgi:hypothetical protein
MRLTRAIAAGVLALALLGAACANDDGGNAGSGGGSTGGAVTGATGRAARAAVVPTEEEAAATGAGRHDRKHEHGRRLQRPHADAGQLPVHARQDHRAPG